MLNGFSMPWKIQETVEHEIKFRIPHRFQFPPDMGQPIPPRRFTSTYFDTKYHRLGQLGLTLRKRVENSHSVWQLKIPSGAVRLELEIVSGSRTIPWEFVDLLTAFFRKEAAVQLGILRTKRTGIRIEMDHQIIAEVDRDSVALIKDRKIVHAFQELEVELQEGTDSHLKSISKRLAHAGAQEKVLQQPKIFEALHLPYPLVLKGSNHSAPPTELIQDSLHAQFFHILRHDPGTRLGRDSEALHQMRVATRRLRAILRTVQTFLAPEWTNPVRREMKWLGSLLGDVRDGDVLLEYFRTNFQDLSFEEQPACQSILTYFEDQRSVARAKLLEGLRSDRYLALLNHLEESFSQLPFRPSPLTISDLAGKTLDKLREVVQASNCLFPKLELHRIRILLKRARYAYELAEPVLGKGAKRFLQQAKSLQDILGQHQDAVVAEHRLLALVRHSRDTGIAYVSGLMVERLRNRQDQVAQQIPEQWKKLEKQGKKL